MEPKTKKWAIIAVVLVALTCSVWGASTLPNSSAASNGRIDGVTQTTGITGTDSIDITITTPTEATTPASETTSAESSSQPLTMTPTPTPSPSPIPTSTPRPSGGNSEIGDLTGLVIVLDPGHQTHANNEQEPVAPWSDETKPKVSAGTTGVSTNRPEYEVVLEIGLKMKTELESHGATVYMTRETNDVNISNIERSQFAIDMGADIFIRLHCDGSDNSEAHGIGVFVADRGTYKDSLVGWGDMLGQALSEATGTNYRGCDASSRYSGLNWTPDIPSFLLEMGFMTNPTEDELLSDSDYQDQLCQGVAAFCWQMKQQGI